jgi:AraC-like DNA-binding protein
LTERLNLADRSTFDRRDSLRTIVRNSAASRTITEPQIDPVPEDYTVQMPAAPTEQPNALLLTPNKKFSGSIDTDSYSRWREDSSTLVAQLYETEADARAFHATHRTIHISRIAASSFDYSSMTYVRSAKRIRKAPCDHLYVLSTTSGGQDLTYADREVSARRGCATLMDIGRPHINAALETSGRGLMVARDVFNAARLDRLHGAVVEGARQRVLDDYIAWLLGALPRAPLTAMARTEEAVAAVVLACFDPASPIQEPAREVLGGLALSRARRFIDAHAAEPFEIGAVAAAACVSRATLYRLFQPFGGVSAYVWRTRLELARRRLSDPSIPGNIGAIAGDVGFESGAHFSRRFVDAYGFSPRNLRPF